MSESNSPQSPPQGVGNRHDDDEISLAELIQKVREWTRIVWGERRFVAKVLAVSVTLGLIIAFGTKPEYIASMKVLPYSPSAAGSGLSGLAGLAGIRIPRGAVDQAITADLYPEVARTLDFRVEVAETPIRFASLAEPVTPMRYFREIIKPKEPSPIWRYTVGLPGVILSALVPADPAESQRPVPQGPSINRYSRDYLAVLRSLEERITATSDKKTAIITITGRMPDPFAAADLVRSASDLLMKRIIEYESKKAAEQLRFVEEQAAAASTKLDRVQREQARWTDRNRGPLTATAQLEAQRLQREYTLAFELQRQFSTELEQARIKKSQDTPVFTVLEQVVVPDRRSSPRRGRIVFLFLAIGLTFAAGAIAVRRAVAPG